MENKLETPRLSDFAQRYYDRWLQLTNEKNEKRDIALQSLDVRTLRTLSTEVGKVLGYNHPFHRDLRIMLGRPC